MLNYVDLDSNDSIKSPLKSDRFDREKYLIPRSTEAHLK